MTLNTHDLVVGRGVSRDKRLYKGANTVNRPVKLRHLLGRGGTERAYGTFTAERLRRYPDSAKLKYSKCSTTEKTTVQ